MNFQLWFSNFLTNRILIKSIIQNFNCGEALEFGKSLSVTCKDTYLSTNANEHASILKFKYVKNFSLPVKSSKNQNFDFLNAEFLNKVTSE